MTGSIAGRSRARLSIERAMLAIVGFVLGSGGLFVAIWAALGYVLR